jgi:NAD(P)-dependent dehydrogenase (short-subunit alcohol dehydrogenase family)
MNKFLSGKTALVTGASRGIGRAVAIRLGREGALVAVHYGSTRSGAEEVVREIEAAGGRAFTVRADIRSVAEIAAMFETLDAELQTRTGSTEIDILVNNAGVGTGMMGFAETDEEAFDYLVDINFKGFFFVCKHAIPRIREGGRVVNISSDSTRGANAGLAAYAASKTPINSLTLSLASLLGPRQIAVNALLPGLVETDLTEQLVNDPQMVKRLVSDVALGRVGQPTDIANAVALLVSPDSGWITGQLIQASGGAKL